MTGLVDFSATPPPRRRIRILDYDSVITELEARRGQEGKVYVGTHRRAVTAAQALRRRGMAARTYDLGNDYVEVWAAAPEVSE